MAGSSGEKTEKATPRKIKKARRDGQIGHTPGARFLAVACWPPRFVLPGVAQSLMDIAQTCLVEVGAIIENPDTGRAMAVPGRR